MGERLKNKVAIITGGASGIGYGTVERFTQEGAFVIVGDKQPDKGAEIERTFDTATYMDIDVCNEADVRAMVDLAVEKYGRLDCMFNNAGWGGVGGEIDQLEMNQDYERTIGVMLTGVVLGVKHAARVMKEQQSGSIISTSSVAGLMGGFGGHIYSAVKAAVIGLTRSVSLELSPLNIRVNAICPGGIATAIFSGGLIPEGQNEDYMETVKSWLKMVQPIPRAGMPEDIANMALFLASDESTFVSGQAFVVDGALTATRRGVIPEGEQGG